MRTGDLVSGMLINVVQVSSMWALWVSDSKSGRVHSKFRSGLNVQFGQDLVFIGPVTALSAFGMSIDAQDLERLLAAVEIGEVVINKGKCLRFYTVGGVWELIYDKSVYVDLLIPHVKCRTHEIATTRLYNYLTGLQLEDKIGLELDDAVRQHMDLLVNSDKDNSIVNIGIIKFLAGRGLGLTPSGDDILLGFTLALSVFGEFARWRSCMYTVVEQQLTTSISIEYTKALLKGYTSVSCSHLVLALDMDDKDEIAQIVSAVAAFGHTSGNDTLYGFLTGLEFLHRRQACVL